MSVFVYEVCRVADVWNDGTKISITDCDPVEVFYLDGDVFIRRVDSRKEQLIFSLEEWLELTAYIQKNIDEAAVEREEEDA